MDERVTVEQPSFEKEDFERARARLEEGTPIREVEWKPAELEAIKPCAS